MNNLTKQFQDVIFSSYIYGCVIMTILTLTVLYLQVIK